MKISKILLAVCVLSLLAAGTVAAAPTDTKTLTINFAPAARATLTLGQSSITFPDKSPDSDPIVYDNEGAVSVLASVRTGSSSTPSLTVICTDLTSGSDTIPISNVSWTASGDAGFVAGTMNKTTAQTAGSWTGSGSRNGSFTYALMNSWNWATGSYSATATYTLTAP